MKCNDIKNNLGAFLDGQQSALDPQEIDPSTIESHLKQCPDCLSDFNQLKLAKEQIASLQAPKLSDSFDNNLAAKIAEFEQQRPHCQTLNGHIASNVVAFKPRSQVTTQESLQNNLPNLQTVNQQDTNKAANKQASIWAIAATVTFTAIGLGWLMLSTDISNSDQTLIAEQTLLEQAGDIIEIETFANIKADVQDLPALTQIDATDNQVYWSDVEVEQFDQYTQLDDGYQNFNCGSPTGKRGCALAADIMVSPLTVTKI